ncbi:MAG: HEAT repeat domain-containing protein [Promethearchaeota archaeon]
MSRVNWKKWLREKLSSPFPREVLEALEEIGKTREVDSFDEVKELMEHPDPDVRRVAAWTLGRLGLPEGIQYLRQGLDDDHVGVNLYSALALGEIDDYRATRALVSGLGNDNWRVRNCCVESIGKQRDNLGLATEALLECLDDNWVQVRQNCAKVLGDTGDPKVVPALCRCLADTYVRKFAASPSPSSGRWQSPSSPRYWRGPAVARTSSTRWKWWSGY